MNEPTIWMQLGISDERFNTVTLREIESVLRTKETIGNMMLLVQDSQKLQENEKLYAAFVIAKHDIMRRLHNKMPPVMQKVLATLLEE